MDHLWALRGDAAFATIVTGLAWMLRQMWRPIREPGSESTHDVQNEL